MLPIESTAASVDCYDISCSNHELESIPSHSSASTIVVLSHRSTYYSPQASLSLRRAARPNTFRGLRQTNSKYTNLQLCTLKTILQCWIISRSLCSSISVPS